MLQLTNYSLVFFVVVPAKPTNLRVVYVSGLTVKVAWVEPQTTVAGIPDSSSLMYKISYRNLASQATRQFSTAFQAATLRLRLANTRYEIKVSAYKAFDARVYGPWSEELTLKSNESGEFCWLRPWFFNRSQGLILLRGLRFDFEYEIKTSITFHS